MVANVPILLVPDHIVGGEMPAAAEVCLRDRILRPYLRAEVVRGEDKGIAEAYLLDLILLHDRDPQVVHHPRRDGHGGSIGAVGVSQEDLTLGHLPQEGERGRGGLPVQMNNGHTHQGRDHTHQADLAVVHLIANHVEECPFQSSPVQTERETEV